MHARVEQGQDPERDAPPIKAPPVHSERMTPLELRTAFALFS